MYQKSWGKKFTLFNEQVTTWNNLKWKFNYKKRKPLFLSTFATPPHSLLLNIFGEKIQTIFTASGQAEILLF